MELKITLACLSLAALGMVTPNEQGQIICASILGSALGGYMGSYYFQGKTTAGQLTFRKRWAANLATGTCLAPMATVALTPRFPDTPPIFIALAAAGVIGGLGVLLLTIFLPPVIAWTKTRFLPTPPTP